MHRPASEHPLLRRVTSPAELRRLARDKLPALARELRECLADHVAIPPGELSLSLASVELAVALNYVYKTPQDRVVFEGDQPTHAHRMLGGRRPRLHAARAKGQLLGGRGAGRHERPPGGRGSAISVALGLACAAAARAESRRVIAVIDERSLTSGLAFEALNHAGSLPHDLLVVLNDADGAFVRGVVPLSSQFARAFAGPLYGQLRAGGKRILSQVPSVRELARRSEKHLKGMVLPGSLFEEMGFNYTGPIDAADVRALVRALQSVARLRGPQFLHVVGHRTTRRGRKSAVRSLPPAEPVACGHGTFDESLAGGLCEIAAADPRLICIHAGAAAPAMSQFAAAFPARSFDAGGEQHAVTLAAGAATQGLRPVVVMRCAQMQRAYDQLVHDVALQRLPVLFALTDAGLGSANAEPHGACDLSFLRCIPALCVYAPADAADCRRLLAAAWHRGQPAAVRFPGPVPAAALPAAAHEVDDERAQVRREGRSGVALLAFGALLQEARLAAEALDATLVNMRTIKPLDRACLSELIVRHSHLVTLEENVVAGGAGAAVAEALRLAGKHVPLLQLGIPEGFVNKGARRALLQAAGLDGAAITAAVRSWLQRFESAAARVAGA